MKREDKEAVYGDACVTALLLFGPPPDMRGVVVWDPRRTRNMYDRRVMEWWMDRQNDQVPKKAGHRFIGYFRAWYKNEIERGKNDGTI
jgi:hypothetical protein